jgi:alpha-glucosidase (family GH31 glycosyl hydrolase)
MLGYVEVTPEDKWESKLVINKKPAKAMIAKYDTTEKVMAAYNELRASWKLGGQALVQRLGDKDYSWRATQLLIPDMTAAGLLGHYYTCPDMVGGGQFGAFLNVKKFDEELIVRSCQVHALMPMPGHPTSKMHAIHCKENSNLSQPIFP